MIRYEQILIYNNYIDSSSSSIQNDKVRVYEGVGRQVKNHLDIFPGNGNIDENTYNSVVGKC